MKIFMLTEGGKDIGEGHMARCTSLYEAFREKEISSTIIANNDNIVKSLLKGKKHKILDWLKKQEILFNIIKDAEIVIIDSYLADHQFYHKVSESVKIPIYLDDNKRIDYPRGIVVNGTIYAEKIDYPQKEDTIYLLGSQYIPIKKEFWIVPEKIIKEHVESVIITFGSNDSTGMTSRILKLLSEKYPKLKKNIIIGKGFNKLEQIRKLKNDKTNLIIYPNSEQMKNVMLESDIAISAGGQTLYELARIGVPTIAISVVKNQLNNVKGWDKAGFIEYAGWWEDKEILKNVELKLKLLEAKNLRGKMAKKGRNMVDGRGSHRVVKNTMNLLNNKF